MKAVFELEWMGGAAERRFRKLRPEIDAFPWQTLDPSTYNPVAVAHARAAWTDTAISEYRAVSGFAEIARALADVRAPLDLIAMAGDFLIDECAHVEMASRVAMALGGAHPRDIDVERFAPRPRAPSPLQRANELILRINCVAEAYSAGLLKASLKNAEHPLVHAINRAILQDESLHCRLGALYFEWALSRIDEAELSRLGRVLLEMVSFLRRGWNTAGDAALATVPRSEIQALGFDTPAGIAPIARDVVLRDILAPLEAIGIGISRENRERLFHGPL